jgi:phosphonate transport system substrate-binding protein
MRKKLFFMLLLFVSWQCLAEKSLSFGIVPQQSSSKLAKLWTPIIEKLNEQSGLNIHFTTAPNILTFEKRLAAGEYDIAYMNPYHYMVSNESAGYQAITKQRDKK